MKCRTCRAHHGNPAIHRTWDGEWMMTIQHVNWADDLTYRSWADALDAALFWRWRLHANGCPCAECRNLALVGGR